MHCKFLFTSKTENRICGVYVILHGAFFKFCVLQASVSQTTFTQMIYISITFSDNRYGGVN